MLQRPWEEGVVILTQGAGVGGGQQGPVPAVTPTYLVQLFFESSFDLKSSLILSDLF